MVLNLSLGWPAELSRTAQIQGGTCQSHEDPFGEAVRVLAPIGDDPAASLALASRYAWALLTKGEMHLEEGELDKGWPLLDRCKALRDRREGVPQRERLLGYIAEAREKWPPK